MAPPRTRPSPFTCSPTWSAGALTSSRVFWSSWTAAKPSEPPSTRSSAPSRCSGVFATRNATCSIISPNATGRVEYNNWEIDGGDNMDNGSNDTLNVYPNVDAIAEVKVMTSNYGAQYGRNGSATIETVTKSGTKDFHGDLFEFLRNDDFNARNYFSYTAPLVPEYKKNDFGGTIGGPVYI